MPYTVYFDSECVMCSRFTRFVAKRDPRQQFRFDSLANFNDPSAAQLREDTDSMIVDTGSGYLVESSAAFFILIRLRSPFKLLGVFRILPRFFTDMLYRFIARHRHRIFS